MLSLPRGGLFPCVVCNWRRCVHLQLGLSVGGPPACGCFHVTVQAFCTGKAMSRRRSACAGQPRPRPAQLRGRQLLLPLCVREQFPGVQPPGPLALREDLSCTCHHLACLGSCPVLTSLSHPPHPPRLPPQPHFLPRLLAHIVFQWQLVKQVEHEWSGLVDTDCGAAAWA